MKLFLLLIFLPNILFAGDVLILHVGQTKKHDFKSHNIVLTNPQVASVQGKTIVGLKSGQSEIKTPTEHLEVYVVPSQFKSAKETLENLIENNPLLKISIKTSKIYIHGQVEDIKSWTELAKIYGSLKSALELKMTSSEYVLKKVRDLISQELTNKNIFDAQVVIEHDQIVIYYSKSKNSNHTLIKQIALKWGVQSEVTHILEVKPMIEIEITIAEVKRNLFQSLGLNLPTQYSAQILPSSSLQQINTTVTSNELKFKADKNQSFAKILARPKLLCRSGETAKFIAGGEIPIKLISSRIADVQWKKYGVILNISPIADFKKRISAKLVTEISLLDEAHVVDGIPGLLTNRIETHFDLNKEKTIALSGLIKNELGRGEQGTPLLAEIPLLGELFKSSDYKQNKTELLVLVTPRVLTEPETFIPSTNDFWNADE